MTCVICEVHIPKLPCLKIFFWEKIIKLRPELSEKAPSGIKPEEIPTSSLNTQGVPRLQLIVSAGNGLNPGLLQLKLATAPSSTESKNVWPSSGWPGSTQTGPENIFYV